jgi:hypothetical protein
MGWIHPDIEGSTPLLNRIVDNKFLTGSNKTRKAVRSMQHAACSTEHAARSTPVTRKEIKDHSTSQFHVPITRGWVNSFVLRYPGKIVQTKSSPQEEQCLQGPQVFLERTVSNVNEDVQGCTAELVFNLDEVGISDWEDRKARKVVVSYRRPCATIRSQTIQYGISRKVKHISVIACVFAAGESLTSYILTSQDSPSVREQLKKHGVRFGLERI